jgi:hypothetical protein
MEKAGSSLKIDDPPKTDPGKTDPGKAEPAKIEAAPAIAPADGTVARPPETTKTPAP